jgi:uncharacterized membrane protein
MVDLGENRQYAGGNCPSYCTHYIKKLAMNKIPTSSQVSLSKGFWFIFRDGEREIAAHGSAISGQERIFVNGELISEKRSLSKTSEHQFTVGNNTYIVMFLVPQILQGKMECSLIKDGRCIQAFRTYPQHKFKIVRALVALLVGAICGLLLSFFKLPFWLMFFVVAIYVAIVISQETKNVVVDKIDV